MIATLVHACETDRPRRGVAVTRGGSLHIAAACHLPAVVDRTLDGAPSPPACGAATAAKR